MHSSRPTSARVARLSFGAIAVLFSLLLALTSLARSAASNARPRPVPSFTPATVPAVASYVLTASLDPESKEVSGSGTITFKNPSARPTSSLFFHLYLNAFEGKNSLFLRDEASRSGQRRAEPGSIEVLSLTSPRYGEVNLWPKGAHTPSDAKDRTDIEVPLPKALAGHETLELRVKFVAKLPQVVERTGWERDFFLVAQWFPKLAKREPNGKWAHFPFHPHGEFYANFGNYDVTLEVPKEYVVGSTGALQELPPKAPNQRRYQAKAVGVHDFAWTAWPQFRKEQKTFGDVEVTLLSPEHSPRVDARTWSTLEQGLKHLQAAYGPYPHPTLTVVRPPLWASRAGGMEYPSFITTGGSELYTFLGIRDVELLTIHELGHQWFQGMLASNEMEHPFLDEGLTSFAESNYLEDTYGSGSLLALPFLSVSRLAGARYVNLRHPGRQAISTSAPKFESFEAIGSLVYARSTLCLETIGRVYGNERLSEALRLYAERFRFRHPTPQDFFDTLGEVLGREAQRQAERMFNDRGTVDLSIHRIDSRAEGDGFVSTVEARRSGALALPAEVVVHFADGSTKRFSLPAKKRSKVFTVAHTAPVRFAEIDPELRVLLDENLENNRQVAPHLHPERSQQFHSLLALSSWALAWLSP